MSRRSNPPPASPEDIRGETALVNRQLTSTTLPASSPDGGMSSQRDDVIEASGVADGSPSVHLLEPDQQ